jgi:hypothetical protein
MPTKLFPIGARGRGTAEIESLPSYIHRMAYRHGIYVGELLRFSENQIRRDSAYPGMLGTLPSYLYISELLRCNRLSKYLVDMFEYLTQQPLSGTFASVISDSFTRSSNELLEGFRWCPECIGEMLELGEEPYFKLIWHFHAVKACPIHRSPFMQACDYCGCGQTTYRKVRNLGTCQHCARPLSLRKTPIQTSDLEPSWEDVGQDVLELVSEVQRHGVSSLPPDGLVTSVDQLFDHYWKLDKEKRFYELLSREKLLAVVYHRKSLCLNDARKLSFRLGISLYDLISGNAIQTTPLLTVADYCPFPKSFRNPIHHEVRDHKAILRRLKKLSRTTQGCPPLSLKGTAKELGVSIGYLKYRFPVQVEEITTRYKLFKEEDYLKKIYLAQKRSLEYFMSRAGNTSPKSRKQAYRQLREETGLPKWVLKKAIQTAYSALN